MGIGPASYQQASKIIELTETKPRRKKSKLIWEIKNFFLHKCVYAFQTRIWWKDLNVKYMMLTRKQIKLLTSRQNVSKIKRLSAFKKNRTENLSSNQSDPTKVGILPPRGMKELRVLRPTLHLVKLQHQRPPGHDTWSRRIDLKP